MKKSVIFFSLCLLTSVVSVTGQSFTHSSFRNGNKYTYEVNYEVLKDTPSWNPEKEVAPISFREAIKIARLSLRRFITTAVDDKWDLLEVKLQRIGEGKSKWIYQIEFYCFLSKQPCHDDIGSFTVYVKLDGRIVEPKIEPDSEPKNIKTGPPIKIVPTKKP